MWIREAQEADGPVYIGRGLGKKLWTDAVARSRALGHHTLTLIADPNAEGFYRKQGAIRVGEIVSAAEATRILPKLKYDLLKLDSAP